MTRYRPTPPLLCAILLCAIVAREGAGRRSGKRAALSACRSFRRLPLPGITTAGARASPLAVRSQAHRESGPPWHRFRRNAPSDCTSGPRPRGGAVRDCPAGPTQGPRMPRSREPSGCVAGRSTAIPGEKRGADGRRHARRSVLPRSGLLPGRSGVVRHGPLFGRAVALPPGSRPRPPPITVLKPLHGDEPLLEQALASVCAQDYPAFQIVFGVQEPARPGAGGGRTAARALPGDRHRGGGERRLARGQPQGRQPDQHAAGGKTRRAGDRRFGPARAARLSGSAGGRRWLGPAPAWSPRCMPACPPPTRWPRDSAPRRSPTPSCRGRCWPGRSGGRTVWAPRWCCGATLSPGSAACTRW